MTIIGATHYHSLASRAQSYLINQHPFDEHELQLNSSASMMLHRRELFVFRVRVVSKPRLNSHLPKKLKSEFSFLEILYWDST